VISELDSSIGDGASEDSGAEVFAENGESDIDLNFVFLDSDATTDMDSESATSLRCFVPRDLDFLSIASLSVPCCLLVGFLGSESVLNLHVACRSLRTFSSTPCLDRRIRRLIRRICCNLASALPEWENMPETQKKHRMFPVLSLLSATHDCKLEALCAFSVFLLSCAELNIGRRSALLQAFVEGRRIERLAAQKHYFLQSVTQGQVLRNGKANGENDTHSDAGSVVSQFTSASE